MAPQAESAEVVEVKEKKTTKAATKSKPIEDDSNESDTSFDWEGYDDTLDKYSNVQRDELLKLYDETLSTVAENEIVKGTVIGLNKREVVINIGFKSEGVISVSEFRYNPNLKIGDVVEVLVENQEDKKDNSCCRTKSPFTPIMGPCQ